MELRCGCEDNRKNRIIETLQDIGCDEKFINQVLQKNGVVEEQIHLLWKKRGQFLERIHLGQKRLDCIDYLIYELKKETVN